MQDAEKVRKQFEQERKQRLEVIKLKPEDKRWAQRKACAGLGVGGRGGRPCRRTTTDLEGRIQCLR